MDPLRLGTRPEGGKESIQKYDVSTANAGECRRGLKLTAWTEIALNEHFGIIRRSPIYFFVICFVEKNDPE